MQAIFRNGKYEKVPERLIAADTLSLVELGNLHLSCSLHQSKQVSNLLKMYLQIFHGLYWVANCVCIKRLDQERALNDYLSICYQFQAVWQTFGIYYFLLLFCKRCSHLHLSKSLTNGLEKQIYCLQRKMKFCWECHMDPWTTSY